jgi:nickel-dependent lactate racemase
MYSRDKLFASTPALKLDRETNWTGRKESRFMDVMLNYGQIGFNLNLPDDWDVTVIRKKPMPVPADPAEALAEAFERPVSAAALDKEAAGAATACVLICDVTRPVPNGLFLRPLIEKLEAAGIKPDGITVLVATGLHRPNEGQELARLVGDPWVLDRVRVVNHFARDDADHVDLGTTRRGTPIRLDRRFVEADVKIATGLVEPHFMAGYSGGRKVIVPGIAHRDTITAIHTASFFEDPKAANCVLDQNPLHEEQLEIVGRLGRVLAVNTVIDEHRRLCFVNYGHVEDSHLQAVDFIRDYAEVFVPRRFKTVITSSAGAPLDATYYQTVKGMVGAMNVLEPGGRMFIASSCSEGLGSPEYIEAQQRLIELGPEGFIRDILPKSSAAVDEWQTEMQVKPMRLGDIYLATDGLSAEQSALTGVNQTSDLARSVRDWVAECGDRRVAVIPEGPYVIPFAGRPDQG